MRIRQRSGNRGREAERLSRGRLFVRLGAMVVTLVLIDVFVASYLRPGQHYDADWRLPRSWPMASLPGYANHIEDLPRDARRPVVLFLGSSPTWGEMNRDRHHTYPAVFARVAHSAGSRARVYNLGTDGALVSDQYFIAGRLAGNADLLAVQLTYHTFNPVARIEGAERFPELPKILGEAVSSQVADVLDIDSTPAFNLGGLLDRALGRRWLLFREHDALAARLFGRPVRNELFARWQDATGSAPKKAPLAPRVPAGVGFDNLDPARQTEIVERYADVANFRIKRTDSELRMLDLLCARLRRQHANAVFFMSPLDVAALAGFEVFDRQLYNANAAVIRAVVERHGLTFIDWNQPGLELPSSSFADITHTTDAGSVLFARRLYRRLAPLLESGSAS